MEDMTISSDFNWVKARSKCSVASVFALLAEVVDSDVKAANELPGNARFRFNKYDRKLIVLPVTEFPVPIVFELAGAVINISKEETALFTARPSLMTDGKCRLEVDGETLELWQVSRKALEALFFGEA